MSLPETLSTPGFVDLHVHFREPGTNSAETIESGTRAALLGGYVLTCDMPNNPGAPTWTEGAMLKKHRIARETAYVPIGFYAGWQPDSGVDVGELAKMAPLAVGLKLYGAPTTCNEKDYEARDFLEAIAQWHRAAPDKPIMFHAAQHNLNDMIGLAALDLGHHLHVCHVNSSAQVESVKEAKKAELTVTSGVCVDHLLKTSHDARSQGWFARRQPPLADQDEAEKLMSYLAAGDIDVIETDHAPHTVEAKWRAEQENPAGIHDPHHTTCFGVPSIEVAAPLMFYQAKRGFIPIERVIDAMSTRPAEIIGVNIGAHTRVSWDMREFRIEQELDAVHSRSGWTPYLGMLAVGVPDIVTINGEFLINGKENILGTDPRVISARGTEI